MPRTRATVCKWRASMATRTVPRLSAVVISVIVPTYNEADSLPALVERLGTAMAGHTWELVVVDDADLAPVGFVHRFTGGAPHLPGAGVDERTVGEQVHAREQRMLHYNNAANAFAKESF